MNLRSFFALLLLAAFTQTSFALFNCGQTELTGCESVTFTLLPGDEIVYTFGGDPVGDSWSSDIFVEINDGNGQCIYFAGYNDCNLTSECDYYAGELGAPTGDAGTFVFEIGDLLDPFFPWTVTVHNAYANSLAVSYEVSTACPTCGDPLNCIEVCPGEDANQLYLPVSPQSSGAPAVWACSLPDNYILAENQACAAAVMASDSYCVENSWDDICQDAYDACPGCTDPSACNFSPLALVEDGSCLEDLDGNGVCDVNEVYGCTNMFSLNFNPLATIDDGNCEYCFCYLCENQHVDYISITLEPGDYPYGIGLQVLTAAGDVLLDMPPTSFTASQAYSFIVPFCMSNVYPDDFNSCFEIVVTSLDGNGLTSGQYSWNINDGTDTVVAGDSFTNSSSQFFCAYNECTIPGACNYNPTLAAGAQGDNGWCYFPTTFEESFFSPAQLPDYPWTMDDPIPFEFTVAQDVNENVLLGYHPLSALLFGTEEVWNPTDDFETCAVVNGAYSPSSSDLLFLDLGYYHVHWDFTGTLCPSSVVGDWQLPDSPGLPMIYGVETPTGYHVAERQDILEMFLNEPVFMELLNSSGTSLIWSADAEDAYNDIKDSTAPFSGVLEHFYVFGVTFDCDGQSISVIGKIPEPVDGCTDPSACNYDATATWDDGSCLLDVNANGVCDVDEVYGCTDESACNYDATATTDGSLSGQVVTEICTGAYGPGMGYFPIDAETYLQNDGLFINGETVINVDGIAYVIDHVSASVYGNECNPTTVHVHIVGGVINTLFGGETWTLSNTNPCLLDLDSNGICDVDDIDGCMDPADCNYNPEATSEGSFFMEVVGCTENQSFPHNYVMVSRGHFEQNFTRFVNRETILSVDGVDYLFHHHSLSNCDEILLYISPVSAPGGLSFGMNDQVLSPGDLIEVRNTPCQSLSFCTECDDAYVAQSVALSTTMLPDAPEVNAWTENYVYTSLKNSSTSVSYLLTGDEIAEFTQGGTTRYYELTTEGSDFENGIVYFDGDLGDDFEGGFLPGSFVRFFLPSEGCAGIGCADPSACNYDADAMVDDGSCLLDVNANGVCDVDEVYGCTDESACNYDASATTDGSLSGAVVMNCQSQYDGNFFGIDEQVYLQNSGLFIDGETVISVGDASYTVLFVNSGIAGNECNPNNVLVYIGEPGEDLATALTGGETWTLSNGPCLELDECGVCGGAGIAEGTCDCDGNLPEEHYTCDGTCVNDTDGDGTCDELEVLGCTDPIACNYDADATEEDGSCSLLENPVVDMTEGPWILSWDQYCDGMDVAVGDMYFFNDNTWDGPLDGNFNGDWSLCDHLYLHNYSGSGYPLVYDGVWDGTMFSGTFEQEDDPEWYGCFTLMPPPQGCMDPSACNYDADAMVDDGSCLLDVNANGVCDVDEVYGCTDESACNYNASATTDGSLSGAVVLNCQSQYNGNFFGIDEQVYLQNSGLFIPGESTISVGGNTYLVDHVNSNIAGNECNPSNVLVYIAGPVSGVSLAEPLVGGETWTLTNAACANNQYCGTCGDAYTDQTIAVATSNLDENEQPTWWGDYLVVDQPASLNTEGSFAVELVQDGDVRVYYIRSYNAESGFMYLDDNHLCSELNAPTSICGARLDEDFEGGFRPGSIVRFIAPCCEDGNGNGTCDLDEGCTYADASNYNEAATLDNGSCIFEGGSSSCEGDLDGNGSVSTSDLLAFLSLFGSDCE